MTLNDEQQEDVSKYLHSINYSCPACKSPEFFVNKYLSDVIVDLKKSQSFLTIMITCVKCAHIDFFGVKRFPGFGESVDESDS